AKCSHVVPGARPNSHYRTGDTFLAHCLWDCMVKLRGRAGTEALGRRRGTAGGADCNQDQRDCDCLLTTEPVRSCCKTHTEAVLGLPLPHPNPARAPSSWTFLAAPTGFEPVSPP